MNLDIKPRYDLEAVVIGTSAGAVEALSTILPALQADYPIPIIVVVHLPPDKKSVMAELLAGKCALAVKEAEDKELLRPGTVYIAPPDYHLLVETNLRLSLSSEEPVFFSRPAIDVLFETAADVFGPGLIGVVLSGASADGSAGIRSVVDAGGTALVQHPDMAYASTMPEAALAICPEALALSLEDIAFYLQKVVSP